MADKLTVLTDEQKVDLLEKLQARFAKNMQRHPDLEWSAVLARLSASPVKLSSLAAMEQTGGEPDVVGVDAETHEIIFADCSAESPAGRRSLCYDEQAWQSRKENRPAGSAVGMAESIGIEVLDEQAYREFQKLGRFDLKTSSWVRTPPEMRQLGGALFCDRRYERVFTYHNGADSYYGVRGFRGRLRV